METSNTYTLLQRYIDELTEEFKVNEFNVKDVQMRIPSRRHFWTSKLINHKIELDALKKKKNRDIREISEKIEKESPIQLTQKSKENLIKSTDKMLTIDQSIRELELIVEFLEKVEKNLYSMTFDIKNIIRLIEMEQM